METMNEEQKRRKPARDTAFDEPVTSKHFSDFIKDKNVYCIFDSDTDGTGCRVVAEYYIRPIVNNFELLQSNIGSVDQQACKETIMLSDVIIFADLVPTLDFYKQLIANNKRVFLFDHHQTTRENFDEVYSPDWYYFDLSRCSAKILFDTLTENKRKNKVIDEYVSIVDIYDRFETEDERFHTAKSMNYLLWATTRKGKFTNKAGETEEKYYKVFVDDQLKKIEKSESFFFLKKEKELIEKELASEAKEYKEILAERFQIRQDNSGNKYGFIENSRRLSFHCMTLLKEYPDLRYILAHNTFPALGKEDPLNRFSLRSRKTDDFDCSKVAKIYKAGGHIAASGLRLEDREFCEKIVKGEAHLI